MKRTALSFAVALLLSAAPAPAEVVKHYVLDGVGNVRVVEDQAGGVLERHDYLPFGEECRTGPCANNPDGPSPLRFTGKERDPETGLDYFGGRYYAPKLARFTTIDPVHTWEENLADPQRWNRYAYTRNNPLAFVDPDGRALETPWDALNVGIGLASFAANVASGNVGGAIVDAVGVVYDATATAVPFLPGGAGTAIRAVRAADKTVDLVRAVDKTADLGRAVDRTADVAKTADHTREGMGFTRSGKRKIDEANARKYGGTNVCEKCKVEVVPGKRHEKGVTPPGNERHRDHIDPRSKGGRGTPDNGQVLCRTCNLEKSDH
jgi:RHS repeat-associated protein